MQASVWHYYIIFPVFSFVEGRLMLSPASNKCHFNNLGAGTVLESLQARKRLVVVINSTLMDNHQEELAHQLANELHLAHATCRWSGVF